MAVTSKSALSAPVCPPEMNFLNAAHMIIIVYIMDLAATVSTIFRKAFVRWIQHLLLPVFHKLSTSSKRQA